MLKQKKEDGNAKFKSSDWSGAHAAYTEALTIDPCNKKTNAKLYCNRAIAGGKVLWNSIGRVYPLFNRAFVTVSS